MRWDWGLTRIRECISGEGSCEGLTGWVGASEQDKWKDNTYPSGSGGYDLWLSPTLLNNLILEKARHGMPTNRQIKQAGSSAFPWNSSLLSVWCSQFNFKVLPRNILKGYDDSINKIADTNLTQQFHMKLPAPEHWRRHVTSFGPWVHSYMNHNTL